ncbi:hypothetical protein CNY89_05755 [Amaricoccus sp. HAR-UPW-R2A-40]|nr:hypothetical protein CNY89_05755 [Amaricoccus sp. HAR-UPW-R2A-40]
MNCDKLEIQGFAWRTPYPRPFTHLSLEERRQLARLRESRMPVAKMATALRRHRSTIHRELKRNWLHDAEVPQAPGKEPVQPNRCFEYSVTDAPDSSVVALPPRTKNRCKLPSLRKAAFGPFSQRIARTRAPFSS